MLSVLAADTGVCRPLNSLAPMLDDRLWMVLEWAVSIGGGLDLGGACCEILLILLISLVTDRLLSSACLTLCSISSFISIPWMREFRRSFSKQR